MKIFLITILINLFVFNLSSFAGVPSKYSNCPIQGKIVSPHNSSGFYMDKECTTAYILPPTVGLVNITGFSSSVGQNGELCRNMNGDLSRIDQEIKNAHAELKSNEEEKTEIKRLRSDLIHACDSLLELTNEVTAKLKLNQEDQLVLKQDILRIDEQIKLCSASGCNLLEIQKKSKESRLAALVSREELIKNQQNKYKQKSDACVVKKESEDRRLLAREENLIIESNRLNLIITEGSAKTLHYYTAMREENGGTVAGYISSEHNDLVNAFKKTNQNLDGEIVFQAMPLTKGVLSFTQLKNEKSEGYPIAKWIRVHGVSAIEANDGTAPNHFNDKDEVGRDIKFGNAVGFDMGINMFGTCQLASKTGYSNPTNSHIGLSGLLAGTSTYQYQLAVSRKIIIKYNEKQLYCLIKKRSSSNGLFRSSSSSSITETSQLNQWLDIKIITEDSDADFVNRDRLLLDLRKEMLDRALINVAKSYLTSEQANLIDPPKPGAPQLATELRKCPNVYCQVGAFALDLGNALFGGTSSDSSNCTDVGAMSEQNLEDIKTVPAFTTQAFKVKESY